MKNDKSKSHFLKLNTIPESLKKEISIQKDAAKKYQKFKKSASQPAYFLNESRLKKMSEIYRAASLQKLSKNYSLNKSKSLHINVTPQKRVSTSNNNSFKKQSTVNTINMSKAFDTSEKTRRLRLDKTLQNQNSNTLESPTPTATKFLTTQIERLQQITRMNTEKAFTSQYDYFIKTLKEQCPTRKGFTSDIRAIVSKFCYLMQLCHERKLRINETKITQKFHKVQIDYATVNTELKKKSFKLQLLIKEIDQLKTHNMKIAKQLYDIKSEKKLNFGSQKSLSYKKKRFQINQVFSLKMYGRQAQLTTPIYQYNLNKSISSESINQFNNNNKNEKNIQKVFQNYNNQKQPIQKQKSQQKIPLNQRLQMIKKIRDLQKRQKDLVKTLLVLKTDGIDVERAFNEVVSGKIDDNNISSSDLHLKKQHMPSYIKKIQNKDSYDADSSIIESIQGLTVRFLQGEASQDDVFFPIKHEYKSKPLDQKMQKKLMLNFDVLYEDYESPQQQNQQSNFEESGYSDHPTI